MYYGLTYENGQINLTLDYGNYYVIEKKAAPGYIKVSDDKQFFDITENKQIVNLTIENQKFDMPKTFNTDLISILIITGTAIVGLGLSIYGKKKKN